MIFKADDTVGSIDEAPMISHLFAANVPEFNNVTNSKKRKKKYQTEKTKNKKQ